MTSRISSSTDIFRKKQFLSPERGGAGAFSALPGSGADPSSARPGGGAGTFSALPGSGAGPSSIGSGGGAGFFSRQRELAKRRLWPIALTFLCWLLYHVVGTVTALSAARENALLNHASVTDDLREALRGMLGVNSGAWLITLGIAAILAIEGFAWMDSRREVDFFESLPVSRKQRFFDICIGSFLYYIFSYAITLELGLLIAGAMGALTRAILLEVLWQALRSTALYLSIYALGVLSAMLTGNVIVACLAFLTLLFYEEILRQILLGYCSEFLVTWRSPGGFLLSNLSAPPAHYLTSAPVGRFGPLLCLLALAVLYFLLAMVCYRLRKNEFAETAVVFRPVRAVVRIAIALMAGLFTGILFSSITVSRGLVIPLLWAVLLTVITACIMQIIYTYDFRALFRHPLEIVTAAVLVLLIYLSFAFDIAGYDRYVPAPEKVADAALVYLDRYSPLCDEEGHQIEASSYGSRYMHLDNVEDVIALARYGQEFTRSDAARRRAGNDFIDLNPGEEQAEDAGERFPFLVEYRMKNGKTVVRSFELPDTVDPALMDAVIGTKAFREGTFSIYHDDTVRSLADNFSMYTANGYDFSQTPITGEQYEAFRNAYLLDLAQFSYSFARENRPVERICLSYHEVLAGDPNPDLENLEVYYPVYPSFQNTIGVLQEIGIWLEPLDYEQLPRTEDYESLSPQERDYFDRIDWSVFSGLFQRYVGY